MTIKQPADIMIVTYNRLELTKQTLDILFKNTIYPYKLIIIDNGSSDNTVQYLENTCKAKQKELKNFLGYHIKPNKKNLGIAIGRNQGLQLSSSNWLCTFDNDVWVPKGWLTECINILQNNKQYASIGVNMEGVSYPLIKLGDYEFQNKQQGNLGTACMVFNRSLHKILGFFNNYNLYGMEDSDWGMRTRVVGFKLGYIKTNGKHLGEGKYDAGEYRAFKTKLHNENLPKFNANCLAYIRKQKSLYIPFKDIYG